MGEDLPAEVAIEWARWGRTHEFVDEADGSLRAEFARFAGPMLMLSFADDLFYAPPRAVESLRQMYVNAWAEHYVCSPRAFRMGHVGHGGFFSERARSSVWSAARDWVRTLASGKVPSRAQIPAGCTPFVATEWAKKGAEHLSERTVGDEAARV
jgi:predicted alpha/beta hydrolase